MGHHARTLTALLAVLVTTLVVSSTAAAPASAMDVKVRVELNQADIFHAFVERQLTTVDPAAANVTDPVAPPGGAGCRPDSAIAALQQVVGATNLQFTPVGDPATATIQKLRSFPVPVTGPNAVPPKWEVYVHGKHVTNPCASMSPDDAGTEVLAYMHCLPNTPASAPCFGGTPVVLRELTDAAWPIAPILTHGTLSVLVSRAQENGDGPVPSHTALLKTDEGLSVGTDQKTQDGSAYVTFNERGPHIVVATDATGGTLHVPDRISVCSTENNDGFCGTTKIDQNPFIPTDFPSQCATNGHDGFCGTTDTTGPVTHVTNIKHKQKFKKKKGPGQVKGTIELDPNRVGGVQLRLTRATTTRVKVKAKKSSKKKKAKTRYRTVKRCTAWDNTTALLESAKCGTKYAKWFDGDLNDLRNQFSYSFAMTLPAGTYTLEVQAADENKFKDAPAPGRNVLTFTVL